MILSEKGRYKTFIKSTSHAQPPGWGIVTFGVISHKMLREYFYLIQFVPHSRNVFASLPVTTLTESQIPGLHEDIQTLACRCQVLHYTSGIVCSLTYLHSRNIAETSSRRTSSWTPRVAQSSLTSGSQRPWRWIRLSWPVGWVVQYSVSSVSRTSPPQYAVSLLF